MRHLLLIAGEPCAVDRLQAIQAAGADAGTRVELLTPATENALRQRLAAGGVDAVWLITRANVRASAGHATVDLRASDGNAARPVNVKHLGDLLARTAGLRWLLLQAGTETGSVDGLAPWLVAQGVPCTVTLPAVAPAGWRAQASGLLRALTDGRSPSELAAAAGPGAAWAEAALQNVVGAGQAGVAAEGPVDTAMPHTAGPPPPAAPPMPPAPAPADVLVERLAQKRAQGAFDVFLCHNGADKPAVRAMARALQARGLLPWLDEWELPPGKPWQPLLERQIERIGSAAVFVGAAGVGPWQEQELYGFLREFVARGAAVIPVLLPDAPQAPELPVFLRAMTWVDFRTQEPDPMLRLHWGITGERPAFD